MNTECCVTIIPAKTGEEVSHGTLRTQDLLLSFAGELSVHTEINKDALDPTTCARLNNLALEAAEHVGDNEEATSLVEQLIDALNEFAPPGTWFGANDGDGSSFGYWPIDDNDD